MKTFADLKIGSEVWCFSNEGKGLTKMEVVQLSSYAEFPLVINSKSGNTHRLHKRDLSYDEMKTKTAVKVDYYNVYCNLSEATTEFKAIVAKRIEANRKQIDEELKEIALQMEILSNY